MTEHDDTKTMRFCPRHERDNWKSTDGYERWPFTTTCTVQARKEKP